MKNLSLLLATIFFALTGRGDVFAQGSPRLPIKMAGYSVPVPPELAVEAAFSLNTQDIQVIEGIDGLSITYQLPAELVGPDSDAIHLFPTNNPDNGERISQMIGMIQFGGMEEFQEVGRAACSRHPLNPKKLNCMVVYDGLPIDSSRVGAFLGENFPNFDELQARLQVAAMFQNEPVGILSIELE